MTYYASINATHPVRTHDGARFTAASTTRPASPAALGFLDSLTAQRDLTSITAPMQSLLTLRAAHATELTAAQCSLLIDALKAMPFLQRNAEPSKDMTGTAPSAPAEVGYYLLNGEVWKVRAGKEDPTRRYALKLVITTGEKGRFEYVAGAIRNLSAAYHMTLEEAKALGHQHGICCICGAYLTDATSVANGIGPICATRV